MTTMSTTRSHRSWLRTWTITIYGLTALAFGIAELFVVIGSATDPTSIPGAITTTYLYVCIAVTAVMIWRFVHLLAEQPWEVKRLTTTLILSAVLVSNVWFVHSLTTIWVVEVVNEPATATP